MNADSAVIATERDDETLALAEVVRPLWAAWRWLVAIPLLAGAVGIGVSYLIPPTFTARATFLSAQQQSPTAAALASLGGLASLAGGSASRSPIDQFAALMQSVTVADRLIDRFGLLKVYDADFRVDARRELANNTHIVVGKKDGLVAIEVDDRDPRRAADIANQYIAELQELSGRLALSEAQQRRVFFEGLVKKSRDDLLRAQVALQGSGFNPGVLRAEPRAAAESYARARADVSAAEVRLQTLRRTLTDSAPEVQRAQAQLEALRGQLARTEGSEADARQPEYLQRYREFKYQETLFELFARQYEVARVDEAREGLLVQVIDPALVPERKSRPKRAAIAIGSTLATLILLSVWIVVRSRLKLQRAGAAR